MSSLNLVILMGGLTRDPELRRTAGGTAITKLSLAVSEKYKNKAGENVETTCYVDIDAWGRLGENCAQYLAKGSPVLVQGKLQFEQWEAKDGSKRSKLSVRATLEIERDGHGLWRLVQMRGKCNRHVSDRIVDQAWSILRQSNSDRPSKGGGVI